MTRYHRRNKLPKPSLQLRLTLIFMGTLGLSIMLQLMMTRTSMLRLALELPNDGPILLQEINSIQLVVLAGSTLLLMPICFVVGVLSTFRLAGPLYRFEDHLRRIVAGEDPGPCRLRKGDQLQDLCQLLNEATDELRRERTLERTLSIPSSVVASSQAPSLIRSARTTEELAAEDVVH